MAFALYAHVAVPEWSTDADGDPDWVFTRCHCKKVRIDNYNTKRRAERAAERVAFVWLDEAKTRLVLPPQIKTLEIVEEP